MTHILIAGNDFTGTPNLLCLPPMLRQLLSNRMFFTGTVDLSSLPSTLRVLSLEMNGNLHGVFDVALYCAYLSYDFQYTQITTSNGEQRREVYMNL